MMKWIEIIASFFFGRMQNNHGPSLRESAMAIFDEITFKSKKTVALIVVSFAATIFALGGFFISLLNATTQYDREGSVAFTSTLASGLVLILLAVAAFVYVFNYAWPGMKKFKMRHHAEELHHHHEEEKVHHREPSSLEHALSLLVMDFVKERELRRAESVMAEMPTEPDFRAPSMARTEDPSVVVNQEPLH